jgi:uncharacterized repeat protein (TIGR01451 family)
VNYLHRSLKLSYRAQQLRWTPLAAAVMVGSQLFCSSTAIAQQSSESVARPQLVNQASYSYFNPASRQSFEGASAQLDAQPGKLVDPLGRILGCSGELLPDYSGFSISLYEPNPADPTGTELGNLVPLTQTEVPDIPNNTIPGGLNPNSANRNPFFLSNTVDTQQRGVYNFLLDPNKGQLNPGRPYILVVNPPANSIYTQRRIKIQIIDSTGSNGNNVVRYIATSLDGQPISATGDTRIEDTVATVANAELIGLDLLAFRFTTALCQPEQASIIKTADRVAAEPGDSVIYRLSVKSRSDADLKEIVLTDALPVGFQLIPQSVQGEIENQRVVVTAEERGSTVIFRTQATIPPSRVLNVAYAARLTPDAIRGSGRNSVMLTAKRADNQFAIQDGPATHQLRIRPGIVSDCGTIIGRVFEDKNFDGEQQSGEPGIPNAIVFLEDGNRITTDANGLFSVANALSGYRTGVLDLSSVPGYTLAPNPHFRERNSQSRMVHLAPGGMVRMNFALTPISKEATQK